MGQGKNPLSPDEKNKKAAKGVFGDENAFYAQHRKRIDNGQKKKK